MDNSIYDTEAILESISDGVFTVNRDWDITYFNAAAEAITGIERSEAVGAKCFDVFRSSMCGSNCALRKTISEGRRIINRGCYFINSRGESIPITVSTAVLHDKKGHIVGGAETFRDLSEIEELKKEIFDRFSAGRLHSSSPSMQKITELIRVIAPTSSTVLIQGETGTGKEVTARTIHELSPRKKAPFMTINCGAIPENLLESELFGHVKGSFTGAVSDKEGLVSAAGDGTLFLDEIGDMPMNMQVKILGLLQEKTFQPVGSTTSHTCSARIIAATNKDLKRAIRENRFREDLYFRLNIINLEIPPLRKRREDILLLAKEFIHRFCIRYEKDDMTMSPDVLSLLQAYSWPGNIRELENAMERAVIVSAEQEISLKALPEDIRGSTSETTALHAQELHFHRDDAEKKGIVQALEKAGYNKSRAAEDLGIHRTT
ncbi:MAG: sigma-54 interaction domain-containing protein, partial [Fibrobacterota bacterium]